jgi:hypothetical protein
LFRKQFLRLSAVASIVTVSALAVTPVAAPSSAGGYAGKSAPGARHMDVELRLNRHGYAIWRLDFFAPCTPQDVTSRTIGTDVQPPTPRLHFVRGRFTLHQHVVVETSDLDQTYTITGHFEGVRIVGSFRAVEHQYGDTCDTGVLRWTAKKAATPAL